MHAREAKGKICHELRVNGPDPIGKMKQAITNAFYHAPPASATAIGPEAAHRGLEARNTKFETNRITTTSNDKTKAFLAVRKSIAF